MNTFGAKSLQRRSSERWGLMGLHACLRTWHGSLEHLASLQLRGGGAAVQDWGLERLQGQASIVAPDGWLGQVAGP